MKKIKRFGLDIGERDPESRAVYSLACVFSALDKEISAYLKPFDLSPVKFNTLMVIKHMGKGPGIRQIDISRQLIVGASNVTRLVDRMIRQGLCHRVPSTRDRRVNLIKITSRGSELLDRAWPGYCRRLKEAAGGLNKRELTEIARLSLKWFHGLENSDGRDAKEG